MAVQRSKLQLVGAACMFIAAKYEEIYPPDVAEFVYITDDTYNKRQVPTYLPHTILRYRYRSEDTGSVGTFVTNCRVLSKFG